MILLLLITRLPYIREKLPNIKLENVELASFNIQITNMV